MDSCRHIPDNLSNILELKAICQAYDSEAEIIKSFGLADFNSLFIIPYGTNPGATIDVCETWEDMLNIIPKANDTLSGRQFRIWTKLYNTLPYTKFRLIQVLDSVMGAGNYTYIDNVETKTLTVRLYLGIKDKVDAITDMLDDMIPANMILDVDLKYNTWQVVSNFTWDELLSYAWFDIKESVL